MSDTTTGDSAGLRRVIGWLFVVGAVAFAVAATVLSSTFEWPDILREPPEVVLPAFVDGGTSLVWTWFAVAWTYAILLVPILLGRHGRARPGRHQELPVMSGPRQWRGCSP